MQRVSNHYILGRSRYIDGRKEGKKTGMVEFVGTFGYFLFKRAKQQGFSCVHPFQAKMIYRYMNKGKYFCLPRIRNVVDPQRTRGMKVTVCNIRSCDHIEPFAFEVNENF